VEHAILKLETNNPSVAAGTVALIDSRHDDRKRTGSSYTPTRLAGFVAREILKNVAFARSKAIRILDPAVGDGELLLALSSELRERGYRNYSIRGFDTNADALALAKYRLQAAGVDKPISFEARDFLAYVLDRHTECEDQAGRFRPGSDEKFDLVIANPPYVRTQVLGAEQAQLLATRFGLSGRTDLYHAFILAITNVLDIGGELGIIVSNRFMTTRSGVVVRGCFFDNFALHHVYDLGDTRLFAEAVLPAVVLGKRDSSPGNAGGVPFTRSHSTEPGAEQRSFTSILEPIENSIAGIVAAGDSCFQITQGLLDSGRSHSDVWRVSTKSSSRWLGTVKAHQEYCFGDIGKIRVGVKTTADKVFIRRNWARLANGSRPEDDVLMPLLTHREARRWQADSDGLARILYTHEFVDGKRRPIDFGRFPGAARYLESQRVVLEKRSYITKTGRKWYEIWVPQDPRLWPETKLVFRDIAEHSTFFLDNEGSIVNGDCYWMVVENDIHPDILWLAMAVGNSSFILQYYDECFHNKLYANRRRFMTQYVKQFPIPDPNGKPGKELVALARQAVEASQLADESLAAIEKLLDQKVWEAFGLVQK
jgi:adenine-specific DNA-methyltransferase